jgi:hypothetical protein
MRATFVTQKHLDDGFARGGAEASPALAHVALMIVARGEKKDEGGLAP